MSHLQHKKQDFRSRSTLLNGSSTIYWQFQFSAMDVFDSPVELEETGTLVRVTELIPSVSVQFSLDSFLTSLRASISIRYQTFLDQGLAIRVNGNSSAFLFGRISYFPGGPVFPHFDRRPTMAFWFAIWRA